jgi:hypothetical protein
MRESGRGGRRWRGGLGRGDEGRPFTAEFVNIWVVVYYLYNDGYALPKVAQWLPIYCLHTAEERPPLPKV